MASSILEHGRQESKQKGGGAADEETDTQTSTLEHFARLR